MPFSLNRQFQVIAPSAMLIFYLLMPSAMQAASTSWKGTTSAVWSNTANWTGGVPTAAIDVVIGDASFTGSFQPTISSKSNAKSFTIGTGAKVCTLTIGSFNLTAMGDVTIGANGTITHSGASTFATTGNWSNAGTYNATNNSAQVTFSGSAAQSLSGAGTNNFKKFTVNSGSTTTLSVPITIRTFTVTGVFNPGTNLVTITSTFTANANSTIYVMGATYASNYSLTASFNARSTVNYGALSNQTVLGTTYGSLQISGSGTKTLAGNVVMRNTLSYVGNVTITAGTLDLSTFTITRSGTGGTFTISEGTILRIGSTNTFPATFQTITIGSTSTVEYYGSNQTIAAKLYGNLSLSSSSGSVTKTLPASAMTVTGNFVSSVSSGSMIINANQALTINGNYTLGASSTFNASSYTHTINGTSFINNGTLTGNTSNFTLGGVGAAISGTGTFGFYDLTLIRSAITAAAAINLSIAGNLSTVSPGTFTHTSGSTGTITMSGTGKTISGPGIILNHLTISGTGSITTAASFSIAGNLSVSASGSMIASSGIIQMSGSSNTITNSSTLSFFAFNVPSTAAITTASSFSMQSDLSVSGALTASAGTVTFTGTSTFSGTANLNNVTLNGTKLAMGNNSVLGIGSAFTLTAGVFDVLTSTPNTVSYNGSGAQSISVVSFNRLTIAGSNTKTATVDVTVDDNFTIASGGTFSGGVARSHTIKGDWINNGTFTASTSTILFRGNNNATISGSAPSTFNIITINKSASTLVVYLAVNTSVGTINMTAGEVRTGSYTLTITTTRTGTGYIYGTITRTHAFGTGTAYEFESPYNTVTFTSLNMVSSITVIVTPGTISDFPSGASVNRLYNISISYVIGYTANIRLHYLDSELNGNTESSMNMWHYNGTTWGSSGKTSNDAAANWVQLNGVNDISNRWTFSDNANIVRWRGTTNTDWATASNWQTVQGSPSTPPGVNDIALLGDVAFTNQPIVATPVSIKGIAFQSTTATTITVNTGGSITTGGSIAGTWTSNATHSIAMGAQNLTVNGALSLSDGTAGHDINLSASTGAVTIIGNLVQTGASNVNFTGAGSMLIAGDYTYNTTGSFTCGTSTLTYNGAQAQQIAGLTYNHLIINKSGGTGTLGAASVVNGNLSLSTGGQLDVSANLNIAGNVTINSGTSINAKSSTISVGGNWNNAGSFVQGSGTLLFNGSGNQTINATTFNNLSFSKTSGTASLTGNLSVNGDLTFSAGTLDLSTYSANRTALGGTITLGSGTLLKVGGASNFPSNYDGKSVNATSTVEYNGTGAQDVPTFNYGNLTFTNGGTNVKSLTASIVVNGDLLINSGTSIRAGANTIDLYGNWNNSGGSFNPSTGTVKMFGTSKNITGRNTFYNQTIIGSYSTVTGSVITLLNLFSVSPGSSYTQNGDSSYFYGDFYNYGTVVAQGVTNFMGTRIQTLANNGSLTSGLSGVINYLGTVAPVATSTSPSTFATVNISNTAGFTPVQGWTVVVAFNVASGSAFYGGGLNHTFLGSFVNNGTVTSSGTLLFSPSAAQTINLGSGFNGSGAVKFAGTGQITLSGSSAPTFGVIEISNTNASGITPVSDWTILGNLTVLNGSIFHAGTGRTINVSGNITNNGTFEGGTSTVIMNDTAVIGGIGTTTFNNLTIASADSALTDFSITGNFVNNGYFDATGYTVTFSGSTASAISGSNTPIPFDGFVVSKTANTVTLNANISIGQDLTVNSGSTLDANGSNIFLSGDWNNNATFSGTSPTSLVIFQGSNPQLIAGSNSTNFGSITINNSSGVTLSSAQTVNGTLTLQTGALTSAGLLTLNLNAGAIAGTGSGSISGNIIAKKDIPSIGYHYLSAPLANLTVADWNDNLALNSASPMQNYYYYNEASVSSNYLTGWTYITSTASSLNSLKGFALYFPSTNTNVNMTAAYDHSVTSYAGSVTLTRSTPAGNGADGWNLVGNPFPSPLDWGAVSGWTRTNIYDAIYYWDPVNNRYASYVNAASTNGGTRYIPAMQSFWIRVDTTGSSNKSVSFGMTNSVRTTTTDGSTPAVWRLSGESNVMSLKVTGNNASDETIVRFSDEATDLFDGSIDAYKLMNDGGTPSFFSILKNNQYSINSLPIPENPTLLPLGLKVAKSGKYSISVTQIAPIDNSIDVVFVDKLLNKTQDLKYDTVYHFDYDIHDTIPRFYLNLGPAAITGNEHETYTTVSISNVSNYLNLAFINVPEGPASVDITDLTGRSVFHDNELKPSSGSYTKNMSAFAQGIYLIQVACNNKHYSAKILIQ